MLYGCRLNRITRVSASACNVKPFLTLSRPPLPGQPEGFSRSDTKRLPARGSPLDKPSLQAAFFPPIPIIRIGPQKGFLWVVPRRLYRQLRPVDDCRFFDILGGRMIKQIEQLLALLNSLCLFKSLEVA